MDYVLAFSELFSGHWGARPTQARVICMAAGHVDPDRKRVVVTGAGGKTGKLILKQALQKPEQYEAIGVVRDESSRSKVAKELSCDPEQLVVADIRDFESLRQAFSPRVDALIIATSAVPKIQPLSIVKVLIGKLIGQKFLPEFTFKLGQTPKEVDYDGQLNQINAAKELGCQHVVLLGSGLGSKTEQFLNTVGGGNILVWK